MTSAYWTEEKKETHKQKMAEYFKKHLHWKVRRFIEEHKISYPKYRTEEGDLIQLDFSPKEDINKWDEFLKRWTNYAN